MAPKQKNKAKESEPQAKKAKLVTAPPERAKLVTAPPKLATAPPEAKKDAKPEPEKLDEKESDAPSDSRAQLKGNIGFDTSDTTLNVFQASGGRILMPLTDGGLQHLIAGARAGVGVKAGRYMYEVRIMESFTAGGRSGPSPKQVLRVGFSVAESSLILGDGDDCLYFEEGGFFVGKKRVATIPGKKLGRDCVAAVLLNLDPKTPNVNTISLFVNGERASPPQEIPEELRGKSLFPHICYRSCTLQVHFGPEPVRALPFKCRTIQAAAATDVSKAEVPALVDGKHEVLFPVGFPDEGTFEWLDDFLQKNKQYVELSDRKILDWAKKSGINQNGQGGSNDKPAMNLGVQGLDDLSASRIIKTVAPLVPRHYVVMEVKSNLVEADRKAHASKFPSRHFKKVAYVVMGEPATAHKEMVKKKLLSLKQTKLDLTFKAKKLEKERKKIIAQKQRELALKQKEAKEAMERKKKAEEDKKAALEAEKKKEEENKKKEEAGEDTKAKEDADEADTENKIKEENKEETKEEPKEEAKEETKEETKEEEKRVEEEEEDDEDTQPETAVLTEEESKMWFSKLGRPDLTTQVLDKYFVDFSIPTKGKVFDEIKYEWQDEKSSKEYLRNWVVEHKRTSRMDTLQPSEWFKRQQADFTKKVVEWQAKQKSAKASTKKKKTDDADEDEKDIFSVDNVCDVGNGDPLFLDFETQDWALMTLGWELHLLATAFKKDVDDTDREKIPEQHVEFYFQKYFKKAIQPKTFGKGTVKELVAAYVKDAVCFDGEPCMLGSRLAEDTMPELLIKLTEEQRRERHRRLSAGDETARLNFTPPGNSSKA